MPKKTKSQSIDELTFEQAFTELEESVRTLERGDLPLEESLALYQQVLSPADAQRNVATLHDARRRALAGAGDLREPYEATVRANPPPTSAPARLHAVGAMKAASVSRP